MKHSAKETRLKKEQRNAGGTRNALSTMGAVHARKTFLDMLKSQIWKNS